MPAARTIRGHVPKSRFCSSLSRRTAPAHIRA
jgi:hypothetical protein